MIGPVDASPGNNGMSAPKFEFILVGTVCGWMYSKALRAIWEPILVCSIIVGTLCGWMHLKAIYETWVPNLFSRILVGTVCGWTLYKASDGIWELIEFSRFLLWAIYQDRQLRAISERGECYLFSRNPFGTEQIHSKAHCVNWGAILVCGILLGTEQIHSKAHRVIWGAILVCGILLELEWIHPKVLWIIGRPIPVSKISGSSLKRSCYGAKSGRLSVNVDNNRVFRELVIWKPAEKGRSSKLSKDDGQAKGEFLQMQSQEPGDCKADCHTSNLFERDNAGGAASVGGKHNTSYAAANGTGLSSGEGETAIEIGGNQEPDAPSVDDIDLERRGNIDPEEPDPIDLEEGGNDGPDPPRRGDDGPDPPRRGNDGPDPPRSSRGLILLVGASWLVDLQLLSTIGNLKSGGSSLAKDILRYMLVLTLACSFFFTLGGKFFRSSRMLRIGVSLTAVSFLVTMVVAVL